MATCQVAYGANFEPALAMISLAFGKFIMFHAICFVLSFMFYPQRYPLFDYYD